MYGTNNIKFISVLFKDVLNVFVVECLLNDSLKVRRKKKLDFFVC
jgi:hypothetical protein